jgi:hypothetical protein
MGFVDCRGGGGGPPDASVEGVSCSSLLSRFEKSMARLPRRALKQRQMKRRKEKGERKMDGDFLSLDKNDEPYEEVRR